MLILRSLAVLVLIAGTWWSMADVAWSSDFIQSHFAGALSQPRPDDRRESGDGLMFIGHEYPRCCVDLDTGRALALFTVLLGGIPMAGLAFAARRRWRTRLLRSTAEPFLLAAFIFQFASLMIASLLALLFVPALWAEPRGEDLWRIAHFLLTAVMSGMALPVWYALRTRVAPDSVTAVIQ